jgi:hypothetical protein
MKAIRCLPICVVLLSGIPAQGGIVSSSYTEVANGTTVDLTATGSLDWIKFGNGENGTTTFLNTTKIGNPVFLPASLTALGTPPPGHSVNMIAFTGQGVMKFLWTNGNFAMYNGAGPVDTVVGETIVPAVNSYPIGLGASFQALAAAQARSMDVYVQGFDANMVLSASLIGGASAAPIVVTPSQHPASDPTNDYAVGRFHIDYSGAGETLTISVLTQDPRTTGTQSAFANAGFFAATVNQATPSTPEPASLTLLAAGAVILAARPALRRIKSSRR